MLHVIFTLDYEIHGNGEGDPYQLMVEPTRRLLDQFDRYGAKLTIMADVAEVLRFKEHWERTGRDDFHYQVIAAQLREAVRHGHDVQLHLHPAYFNARLEGRRWLQDWSEYNFAGLMPERMSYMIRVGKAFLEELLRPVKPEYRCLAFRAANWAAQPSLNLVRALVEQGFTIETSVFKYGRRQGLVEFDYSHAPSNLEPWPVDEQDVCRSNPAGKLWEFPIYCEQRWLGAFLTPLRIYRALLGRLHRVPKDYRGPGPGPTDQPPVRREPGQASWMTRRHAWKADFNQCTGRQLNGAIQRAAAQDPGGDNPLPFVLIGHSKLFTRLNERFLTPFLAHVAAQSERFKFGTFGQFEVASAPSAVGARAVG